MLTLSRSSYLYAPAQIRDIEKMATELDGLPSFTLMQRAADAALRFITAEYSSATHWLIACGKGNNAGDGMVLAVMAAQLGLSLTVVLCRPVADFQGDAARAYGELLAAGIEPLVEPDNAQWPTLLEGVDLVVDALLGIGLKDAPRAPFNVVIEHLNQWRLHTNKPLIALDVPSGLNAENGVALGACIHASHTLCFVGLKTGLFTGQARGFTGLVSQHDLGISPSSFASENHVAEKICFEDIRGLIPRRHANSYKHKHGHLLILGGSDGMGGAAILCAEAALRSGVGVVSVGLANRHSAGMNARCPEVMTHDLSVLVSDIAVLPALLKSVSAVVVGPGLRDEEHFKPLLEAIIASHIPAVWDAGALRLAGRFHLSLNGAVLTPHPGEAGFLLKLASKDVEAHRYQAARLLAQRSGAVVVLKGAGSLIAAAERTAVIDGGNGGMATAGSGDVLSGIVGALLAQKVEPFEAAIMGTALHAAAGDRVACEGATGMVASDIITGLRSLLNA